MASRKRFLLLLKMPKIFCYYRYCVCKEESIDKISFRPFEAHAMPTLSMISPRIPLEVRYESASGAGNRKAVLTAASTARMSSPTAVALRLHEPGRPVWGLKI